MASYPDVPKFIRDEMQELKSNAARPSRWEVYEWLDFYKRERPEEKLEYGKEVWLGRILGSASYFVTLEKGRFDGDKIPAATDKVIKILRAGAGLDSSNEFAVFEKMLYDLGAKGVMEKRSRHVFAPGSSGQGFRRGRNQYRHWLSTAANGSENLPAGG